MHSIRVLVGSLPATLRRTVLDAVAADTGAELIGVADRPMELLRLAGALQADVVVVAAVEDRLPGIASHLVDQFPDVRVLAVAADACTALSYDRRPRIDVLSGGTPHDLVATIRATCNE